MNDHNLEKLLAEFVEKINPLMPFMANERGIIPTNLRNISPDEWLVNKAAIWRFAKECEGMDQWPENRQRSYRSNMAIYQDSLDAAHRYIVARDFNEFREDKWRVLAKVAIQP
ncbi:MULTISPECIES: hypothetical protein [Sphingobium]|uniref:hypothetical protein n=1 Tax=Sphingobium TaxID=165695 RepID=UPI001268805E|nr:hypothetical protein [Sphingobium lactosutens]MEA3542635.1 hypothetical protein [Pseudomonadota bacterium]